jgi:hypothetical protein
MENCEGGRAQHDASHVEVTKFATWTFSRFTCREHLMTNAETVEFHDEESPELEKE